MRKLIATITALLCAASTVNATFVYFQEQMTDGEWTTVENWSSTTGSYTAYGSIPLAGDDVVIESGETVFLDNSYNLSTINSINVIGSMSADRYTLNTVSGVTIQPAGAILTESGNANVDLGAGTLNINSGATLKEDDNSSGGRLLINNAGTYNAIFDAAGFDASNIFLSTTFGTGVAGFTWSVDMSAYSGIWGQTFTLATFDRADISWHTLDDTFSSMTFLSIPTSNNLRARFSYTELTDGSNDAVVFVKLVPEPSSLALIGLAMGAMALVHRLRQ